MDGKIYAIGGCTEDWRVLFYKHVEVYDSSTDTWARKSDMPTERWALGTCVVDGKISEFVLNPASGPFSVFAWVKDGAPEQVVISQIDGANWLSADLSHGKLMTGLTPPAGRTVPPPLVSEFVITDGDWHRVGFVWYGSQRMLYVDDVEVAADVQGSLEGSVGGLYIGAGNALNPGNFWFGLIDDVRIYNREITP